MCKYLWQLGLIVWIANKTLIKIYDRAKSSEEKVEYISNRKFFVIVPFLELTLIVDLC